MSINNLAEHELKALRIHHTDMIQWIDDRLHRLETNKKIALAEQARTARALASEKSATVAAIRAIERGMTKTEAIREAHRITGVGRWIIRIDLDLALQRQRKSARLDRNRSAMMLARKGWSSDRIGRKLGISAGTVNQIIRQSKRL